MKARVVYKDGTLGNEIDTDGILCPVCGTNYRYGCTETTKSNECIFTCGKCGTHIICKWEE